MSLLTWQAAYNLSVPVIDAQHLRLLELANQLHDAMARGKEAAVLEGLLAELVAYARTHFACEERMLRAAGYPRLSDHQAAHEKLTRQVMEFQERFRAGKVALPGLGFLRDWLVGQIQGTDKCYASYIARRGR